jgi:AraC-like DNA-binding protein
MMTPGHLRIEALTLQPGQEWLNGAGGWLFLRLACGAAYWLGEPRTRSLVEGELLVIPPKARGVVRASQINEVVLHGFSFSPELLWGVFSLDERRRFELCSEGPTLPRFLPSTHPAAQRLATLVQREEQYGMLTQRAEAFAIFAAVFDEQLDPPRPPASPGPSARHRFQQLVAQMPDVEMIHQTAGQLARFCGCSARHFNRLFRKHFGVSVRSRQTELRLLKARQLLDATNDRVVEIAIASGYRNLSLFNSLFKRRFGMTPTEWRHSAGRQQPGE